MSSGIFQDKVADKMFKIGITLELQTKKKVFLIQILHKQWRRRRRDSLLSQNKI
jgi:hypothetical protein